MAAQSLMTGTYALASSAVSAGITLTAGDANIRNLIAYNSDQTYPVFLVSGATAPTAVAPASASVPVKGKWIAPGGTQTFEKPPGDGFLAAISTGTGTGSLYVSVGEGE